ncbi:MAG TPA: hypothetical protein VL133_07110 [Devosia sp.]|nr:hypothetical protein [Devosia sp.]
MHRSDKHALLVLACMVIAIVAVSAMGLVSRYLADNLPPQIEAVAVQDGPEALPVAGEDGHFLGDSLAQWVMAIFTIVATGVSIAAVRLVHATLLTSQEATKAATAANKTAQDIGTAQIRAYVGLVDLRGTSNLNPRPSIEVSVSMNNSGQTPARNISCRVWMVRIDESDRRVLTHRSRTFDDPADLMPAETRAIFWERYEFFDAVGQDGKNPESLSSYKDGKTTYLLEGHIRYRTVMGDLPRSTEFAYRISGWDGRGQVALTFTREGQGNRYT